MRQIIIGDLIGFAGLALAGYGLWLYDPRAAMVSVGSIMLILGIRIAGGRA